MLGWFLFFACLALFAPRVDTDSLAHTIYRPGSAVVQEIIQVFGTDIVLPGTVDDIDRKRLGGIVFADPNAMQKLEQIVWPHIRLEIQRMIGKIQDRWEAMKTQSYSHAPPTPINNTEDALAPNYWKWSKQTRPVIVVEAAVLLDAGWQDIFLDAVWVVTVPRSVAIQRITTRRNLTVTEAEKRIEAQFSRRGIGNIAQEVEKKVVTATIDNSGTLEQLKQNLERKLDDASAWYSRCG